MVMDGDTRTESGRRRRIIHRYTLELVIPGVLVLVPSQVVPLPQNLQARDDE